MRNIITALCNQPVFSHLISVSCTLYAYHNFGMINAITFNHETWLQLSDNGLWGKGTHGWRIIMKIAIPVWEEKISPVLDTASRFLIVETVDDNEVKRFEFKTREGDITTLLKHLKSEHIHVMVCGALSRSLKNVIRASGIYIWEGITGPVDSVLSFFIKNKPITSDYIMPGFNDVKKTRSQKPKESDRKKAFEPGPLSYASELDDFVNEIQNEVDNEVRSQYGDTFYERWKKPQYLGSISSPDGYSKVKGSCGEYIDVSLKIEDKMIVEARFTTNGCAPAQVCGSLAAELAEGKTIKEAKEIDGDSIMDCIDGLPKEKRHCAEMAAKALNDAITNYLRKTK